MSTQTRVIALGQAAAGDDGVGLAVLDCLRTRGVPRSIELTCATEESALVDLLQTDATVVLVDAVLGTPPGEVIDLSPEQLASCGARPISTHGIGVAQAINLAHVLHDGTISRNIHIVAVTIARPRGCGQRLSRKVAAAVPRAAQRVMVIAET